MDSERVGSQEAIIADMILDRPPRPYHNCPSCGGAGDDEGVQCETCTGTGIVYETAWRQR